MSVFGLGYGAHEAPALAVAETIVKGRSQGSKCLVVASVLGTEEDLQCYSKQVAYLKAVGVHVCSSNAQAVELCLTIMKRISERRRYNG